jgi:hypothetical protein
MQNETLAAIEHAMTEIDLILWTWQTDLDMMSFIGQDATMQFTPASDSTDVLIVKRVPLIREEDGKRHVIGVAEVDRNSGVFKAEVKPEYAELFTIPGAYSIRDGEPPEFDHASIKAQLKRLANPHIYANPFKIQGVTTPLPDRKNKELLVEPTEQQKKELQNLDDEGFFDFLKDAGRISGAKWGNQND